MEPNIFLVIVLSAGLYFADRYILTGLKGLQNWRITQQPDFYKAYRACSFILIVAFFIAIFIKINVGYKGAILMVFFLVLFCKLIFLLFVAADDLRRYRILKAAEKTFAILDDNKPVTTNDAIPRSEFLLKAGVVTASLPFLSMGYGIVSGAYDYQVINHTLYLPNLPKKFDGIRLGQISDIHSGSFYNKKAVTGGVEMLMREKADFIFFTGDLVNTRSEEMKDYQDIFAKVKAPLGVYSSLGNHDYGDYYDWDTPAEKKRNLDNLKATHKNMGWDLILNSNRRLKVDGEEIGILGVENWGSFSRFPKYGRIDLAVKNTDDLPVKLLLSHDPTYWRAHILDYKQVDMTFAGHTHGMQFGVKTKEFQWSPIEYVYQEWSGLYREGNQQLYVNTGYGFLGYPGRVGILPEITIFTLKASEDPGLKNKLS